MTIQVNETMGSRTLETFALAAYTAKRVFIVFNDDPSGDPITPSKALRARGVPQIESPHPENSRMILVSHALTSSASSNSFVTIVCNYKVKLDEIFTTVTTGVRGLFMDAWRNYPDPPPVDLGNCNSNTCNGITEQDMNGTPVDVMGKPVSLSIFQQTAEIRSPFADQPDFGLIRTMTNRRNDSDWLGFPRGVMLYLGASATATNGNIWTTTHKFAADQTYHARQIAMRQFDGKIKTTRFGTTKYAQAEDVRWVQKFPQLGNFYSLAGSAP